MDSSFISAKTKEDYCTKLSVIAQTPASSHLPKELRVELNALRSSTLRDYRSRMVEMMSMTLGLMAAVMTASISLLGDKQAFFTEAERQLKPTFAILFPILAIFVTMITAAILNMSYLRMRRRERSKRSEDDEHNQKSEDDSLKD